MEKQALEDECKELQIGLKEMTDKYNKVCRDNIDESKYMEWGCDEIANWIISLNEKYGEFEDVLRAKLKEEMVNGAMLSELDKSDLHRFGVILMQHKLEIIKEIKRLTSQVIEHKDEGNQLLMTSM